MVTEEKDKCPIFLFFTPEFNFSIHINISNNFTQFGLLNCWNHFSNLFSTCVVIEVLSIFTHSIYCIIIYFVFLISYYMYILLIFNYTIQNKHQFGSWEERLAVYMGPQWITIVYIWTYKCLLIYVLFSEIYILSCLVLKAKIKD